MDKLLTIVVPSYNVEATLRQTVESLLVPDQELRHLLDVLIVNDGSKDGTLALAKQLEAENPGIVRVWDKENGGHGSTINVGIDHGYGKYLKIVDGDDWLETDVLELYLRVLSETDADVVATDYYRYFTNDRVRKAVKSSQLPYDKLLQFSEVWDDYTFFMLSLSVKTELLRQQRHHIDERCYYVDVEFDTLVALVAETILYVDMKLYVYRLQNGGQSVSVQGWMKHYPEHERVVFSMISWFNELSAVQPELMDKIGYIEKRLVRSAGGHYKVGLDFSGEERKEYLKHLKVYDAKLKQAGSRVYALAGRNVAAKWCRATRFSVSAYSFLGFVRAIASKIKAKG